MTIFKKVLCGVLGICLLASLPLAHADSAGTDGASLKGHAGQRVQEIYSRLNLTDDQKKQLEANKQQHRAKTESERQQLKADREALEQELMRPQIDMAKINGIHQQIKSLRA